MSIFWRFAGAFVALVVLIAPVSQSSANEAKRADIQKLMKVTKADQVGAVMIKSMSSVFSTQLKRAFPRMPPAARDIWIDHVQGGFVKSMPQLINRLIPVYEREFTHKEIKDLIKFYQTPLGRKASAIMPKIQREGFVIGRKWGQELGRQLGVEAMKKVREAGYDPATFK